MAEFSDKRAGELIRKVFEILLPQPGGLPGRLVLARLEQEIPLTEFELSSYEARPNDRRFETFVHFQTLAPVKAGWMTKENGLWAITELGRKAYADHQDPIEFSQQARRFYQQWRSEQSDSKDSHVTADDAVSALREIDNAGVLTTDRSTPGWHKVTDQKSWLFQANPKHYNIREALANLDTIAYRTGTSHHDISVGDHAYFWESGKSGGLLGTGEITGTPTANLPKSEAESRYYLDPGSPSEPDQPRVPIRITGHREKPVGRDVVQSNPILKNMRIMRMAQGTCFPLTPAEAAELDALLVAPDGEAADAVSPRLDPQAAAAIFAGIEPNETLRRACLEFLANTITRANEIDPKAWSVSIFERKLNLNVGNCLVFHMSPEAVGVSLVTNLVDRDLLTRLAENAGDSGEFASVPGSRYYRLPPSEFVELQAQLVPAHEQFMRLAASKTPHAIYSRSHSPAVLSYLEQVLGRSIPHPSLPVAPSVGPRYWKVAPGESGHQWDQCRREGFVGVGWNELGDLTGISNEEFDRRQQELVKEAPEIWAKAGVKQALVFSRIRPGDRIVANRGTSEVVGVGTVTGPYEYHADAEHRHQLPVHWDHVEARNVRQPGWRRTLIQLDAKEFGKIAALYEEDAPVLSDTAGNDLIAEGPSAFTASAQPALQPAYPLAQLASDTGLEEDVLSSWLRAVARKGQAVFYGPPGTGKTFVAERLARHLVAGTDGFVELVQFHPAYAYEDFIQGIRPKVASSGGLTYDLVPGRFLDFCRRAEARSGPCVLIVDEINRANLSRVFGELMYLLEYRNAQVPLASGGLLRVPTNVRIVGTMNTADRSIALVDHALRRRFAFLPLRPNYDILAGYHARNGSFSVDGLVKTLRKLNHEISDAHYEIGISFFLHSDLATTLPDIWRHEIEPYLEEYFFDRPSTVEEFRWERIATEIL